MLRRRWPIVAVVSVAVGVSVADHCGVFGALGPDRQRYDRVTATITHVVDGDTFDIDIPDSRGPTTRIRLLGIDCPEIAHAAGETNDLFGPEAADFAKHAFVGKIVKIVLDPTRPVRDKHGRLLAYLFFVDASRESASINQQLIDQGLAFADWRFEHVHELRFERSERLAMRAKIGMWKEITRERMPQWRREMQAREGDRRR